MSDSIKKYEEMYDKKLEEKMISKGFGEKDSHDEEHVMKVVCKHFDLELTDTWSSDCDHYIYEESTADGYTVYVSLYECECDMCKRKYILYDNDLSAELKQAIYTITIIAMLKYTYLCYTTVNTGFKILSRDIYRT